MLSANTTQHNENGLYNEWAVLFLTLHLKRVNFVIGTDLDSHKRILNRTDSIEGLSIEGLARWNMRPLEFKFDKVHKAGVKHQAADLISSLSSIGGDSLRLEDDLPFLSIAAEFRLAGTHICVSYPNSGDVIPLSDCQTEIWIDILQTKIEFLAGYGQGNCCKTVTNQFGWESLESHLNHRKHMNCKQIADQATQFIDPK